MNLIIEDVRRLIVRPEIIKAGLFININIRFYHLFHYNIPPPPPYNNTILVFLDYTEYFTVNMISTS